MTQLSTLGAPLQLIAARRRLLALARGRREAAQRVQAAAHARAAADAVSAAANAVVGKGIEVVAAVGAADGAQLGRQRRPARRPVRAVDGELADASPALFRRFVYCVALALGRFIRGLDGIESDAPSSSRRVIDGRGELGIEAGVTAAAAAALATRSGKPSSGAPKSPLSPWPAACECASIAPDAHIAKICASEKFARRSSCFSPKEGGAGADDGADEPPPAPRGQPRRSKPPASAPASPRGRRQTPC